MSSLKMETLDGNRNDYLISIEDNLIFSFCIFFGVFNKIVSFHSELDE